MAEPTPPPESSPPPPPVPADSGPKDRAAVWLAGASLFAFGVLLLFLLSRIGLSDLEWSRATYLLAGAEAIAYAAAGFLFGREVQRGRAESAETRAQVLEKKADQATTEAQRGKDLAQAIHVMAGQERSRLRSVSRLASAPSILSTEDLSGVAEPISFSSEDRPRAAEPTGLAGLSELAARLFPG